MEIKDELPQLCLDFFIRKFSTYPSFIEVKDIKIDEKIIKYLDKFHLVWFYDKVLENGKSTTYSRLYEYDSTGIMIYINNNYSIFILTLPSKKSISEFLINTLKRIK